MELIKLQNQINLLEKAYKTLSEALESGELTSLEKDGVIQRFEYTIELSWKTLRKMLDYKKISFINSPKDVLKESFKLGIIEDLDIWEDFLDIRNLMSHMYSEYISDNSFEVISGNYKEIKKILENLKIVK